GQQVLRGSEQKQAAADGGEHPRPAVGAEDAKEEVAVPGGVAVGEVGERWECPRLVEEVEADGGEDGAEDERRASGQAHPLLGARRGRRRSPTFGAIRA